MFVKEKTFLFKLLISLDRLLNVVTGGSFMLTLSTRTYIRSEGVKDPKVRARWVWFRKLLDTVLEDNHCYNAFRWERRIKQEWLDKHTL